MCMKGKITCNRYEKSSLLPSKGILPTLIDDEEYQRNNAINAENSRRSTVVRIVTDSDSDDKALVVGGSNQGSSKFCYADRRRNSGVSSSVSYFHLYLCLGMMGFVVFWLVLMLRIYLPEAYWTWSYIWWPLTMMQKKDLPAFQFLWWLPTFGVDWFVLDCPRMDSSSMAMVVLILKTLVMQTLQKLFMSFHKWWCTFANNRTFDFSNKSLLIHTINVINDFLLDHFMIP